MRRRHAAVLVAIGGPALVGAGCYGDTDAPSEIGAHAANLNFHGKANNGPAYSYLEYWKTGNPANKLKTPTRNWPAGAEGSFHERPQHLSEQTGYSYRLCGNDQGKDPICASTKQFMTGRAVSTAALDSSGVVQFKSDPGVNDNLYVVTFNLEGDTEYRETFCPAMTCGSHISPGAGCHDISGTGYSSVVCPSNPSVKLGDLDDTVTAIPFGQATIDGGPGDDSLSGGYFGDTLIGGYGQDVITAGSGNDTINARNARFLGPDTDKSISYGEGEDTVIADRSDPISAGQNGCEHVSKP